MRARHAHLLAGAAVAGGLLLAGCGASDEVSISQLAESQGAFAGRQVEAHGTVREEHDPGGSAYFVLAGSEGTLVGLKPAAKARRYVGDRVNVTGRFEVQPHFGRVIEIGRLSRGS